MTRRSTPAGTPRSSSGADSTSGAAPDEFERAVSEVEQAAKEEQALLSRPIEMVGAPWYRHPMAAAVLALLALAIWGAQLALWRLPEPQLSARDREAALRYAMSQQVARIEDFRQQHQRLPQSLAEVAESYRGMSYVMLDSVRYRLTGSDAPLALSFHSDSSMKAFLGGSLMLIQEHKK